MSSPYFGLEIGSSFYSYYAKIVGHTNADDMDRALKRIITLYAWLVFLLYFTSNGMSVRGEHVGSNSNDDNPGKYQATTIEVRILEH